MVRHGVDFMLVSNMRLLTISPIFRVSINRARVHRHAVVLRASPLEGR